MGIAKQTPHTIAREAPEMSRAYQHDNPKNSPVPKKTGGFERKTYGVSPSTIKSDSENAELVIVKHRDGCLKYFPEILMACRDGRYKHGGKARLWMRRRGIINERYQATSMGSLLCMRLTPLYSWMEQRNLEHIAYHYRDELMMVHETGRGMLLDAGIRQSLQQMCLMYRTRLGYRGEGGGGNCVYMLSPVLLDALESIDEDNYAMYLETAYDGE